VVNASGATSFRGSGANRVSTLANGDSSTSPACPSAPRQSHCQVSGFPASSISARITIKEVTGISNLNCSFRAK
jgi:hypothetical protein